MKNVICMKMSEVIVKTTSFYSRDFLEFLAELSNSGKAIFDYHNIDTMGKRDFDKFFDVMLAYKGLVTLYGLALFSTSLNFNITSDMEYEIIED